LLCCFFFSSRRRHTRSDRDWSSDVCSSDLCLGSPRPARCQTAIARLACRCGERIPESTRGRGEPKQWSAGAQPPPFREAQEFRRSEERRVGKEGRSVGGGGQVVGEVD